MGGGYHLVMTVMLTDTLFMMSGNVPSVILRVREKVNRRLITARTAGRSWMEERRRMSNINYQMTELYGMRKDDRCRECAKYDPETKMCSEARAKVISIWVACGRFEEKK